jgi:hypothetical protein
MGCLLSGGRLNIALALQHPCLHLKMSKFEDYLSLFLHLCLHLGAFETGVSGIVGSFLRVGIGSNSSCSGME